MCIVSSLEDEKIRCESNVEEEIRKVSSAIYLMLEDVEKSGSFNEGNREYQGR